MVQLLLQSRVYQNLIFAVLFLHGRQQGFGYFLSCKTNNAFIDCRVAHDMNQYAQTLIQSKYAQRLYQRLENTVRCTICTYIVSVKTYTASQYCKTQYAQRLYVKTCFLTVIFFPHGVLKLRATCNYSLTEFVSCNTCGQKEKIQWKSRSMYVIEFAAILLCTQGLWCRGH